MEYWLFILKLSCNTTNTTFLNILRRQRRIYQLACCYLSHSATKMGLTSRIVPYLALLSLLVSCIPGAHWLFKRFRRIRRGKTSNRDQQQDCTTISTNRQHPSYAILLDDYAPHPCDSHLHTINDGTRQVPGTYQRCLFYRRPLPDSESPPPWLDTTHHAQNVQGPVRLRTEQHWYLDTTWYGPTHEHRFSQGVKNQYQQE